MERAARAGASVLALLVAAGGLLLASTRLRLPELLRGGQQGYGVRELAYAALTGLAVGVCALAVLRLRRGSLRWAYLPVVAAAVLALAPTPREDTVVVYDAGYVPLTGVTLSRAYSSELTVTYRSSTVDLALLSLAVLSGAALPLLVLLRERRLLRRRSSPPTP